MRKRALALFLLGCLVLGSFGCAGQPPQVTTTEPTTEPTTQPTQSTEPTQSKEEPEMTDYFGALFPQDGNIPTKKEFDEIVGGLAENASRISEINYTWIRGKRSMEVLSGIYDDYRTLEAPQENPVQQVYGESQYYNYLLYLPEGYDPADTETKWPVIYFFHGIGEIGSDLDMLTRYGMPKYLTEGGKVDAIMIAPQCPEGSHWADTDVEVERLAQFVPEMTAKYNINTNRMYLTGLSMGGRCTWKLALAMPDTFAAIAVVCGRTNTYEFETIADMPIWMFHGVKDDTVSFDNINKILPVLEEKDHRYYKLTVFPTLSHDVWTTVYGRPDVYEWLLSQSLEKNAQAVK